MIKIYGMEECPHCRHCKASFDAAGVEYDFRDIGESLRNLAVFMRIRDLDPLFFDLRGTGRIGIPALVMEDRSVRLDWQEFLAEKGFQPVEEIPEFVKKSDSCRIDGEGC